MRQLLAHLVGMEGIHICKLVPGGVSGVRVDVLEKVAILVRGVCPLPEVDSEWAH